MQEPQIWSLDGSHMLCSTAPKEKRPTDLPPSSSVVEKSDTVSLRQDQGHSRAVFLFRLSRRESISLPFAPSKRPPTFLLLQSQEHNISQSWICPCILLPDAVFLPPCHTFKDFSDYIQFSSVVQSCLTLWDPMNCSTPGLPIHHQVTEFTQTHVH